MMQIAESINMINDNKNNTFNKWNFYAERYSYYYLLLDSDN